MTRVLSVASECAPLVKTGGLADVAGALPGALAPLGVHIRTLLPGYPAVMAKLDGAREVLRDGDLFGGPGRVLAASHAGLDLLVLDAPHLFDREGSIYLGPNGSDWPDNPARYAALCWVAARIAGEGLDGWHPEVLHCHDWQAGFAPVYLRDRWPDAEAGAVITIHNVAFQGLAAADRLSALRLPPSGMQPDGFEYWGRISALKAGLVWSDRITTVSPTYADELLTPEFGTGLDGVLRAHAEKLTGILNGVDLEEWTPPYRSLEGKAGPKAELQRELGLGRADGPLCVVVSRLTEQKGMDLLLEALPHLLAGGGQLALLGSGEPALEDGLRHAARDPNVAVRIGYDEGLARRLITGGDAILVPSRFEPCGLTQLYGLRFGTLPVVTLTGGLADTVIPATPAGLWAGVATGLQVHPIEPGALARAFDRLCALWREPETWAQMARNAMRHPVGWDRSAAEYAALYREVAG
ncbi:glycogen synthase GlgA [Jannaschia ovalis]|uniref:Glycogen synthase n=1 Tax=Jannaschia ovalis TaxID=3038773 RepID=A0ABY8LBL9_9RHOB|nr:glycogen synthase GlgA [Jannaschia sp. GRR-S6-38]WGH78728.1 glycogen synthase GlgA [Jannaschia sp. GRR-S6-38]